MDAFGLSGLTRDDGDCAGLTFAVGGFDEVEGEVSLARMLVHAVAGEAVLSEKRSDLTVEVDGGRGGGEREQCDERKAGHGVEGSPGGVRPDKDKTL